MYSPKKKIAMFSTITNDIKVTVLPEYDAKNSCPSENRFVFRYHVMIENLGTRPIKVLRRKWLVYDVGFGYTEITGEGVIGLTPTIVPGDIFTYFSNVVLRSGFGYMKGSYYGEQGMSTRMELEIPRFSLIADVLNN